MKQSVLALFATLPLFLLNVSAAEAAGGRSNGGGIYFEETFVPVYVNRNDTTSFNTSPGVKLESGFGIDSRTTLGYAFAGSWLVGFTYNTYSLTTKRSAVENGDSGFDENTKSTEMGPTIGYLRNGWRIAGTYFILGERSKQTKDIDSSNAVTSDITTKNTKLSGFQLAFGYSFALGSHFEIGPSLIYKTLTYSNQSRVDALSTSGYADSALFTKRVDNSLTPMISMQLRF